MTWISVDAGTSIIKAVAFDGAGREIAVARQKMEILRPAGGFAEQSMLEVWEAVVAVVREVAAELKESIEGIAVTAQGDGCWLVGQDGMPAGDAILWNDARAAGIVEEWRGRGVIEEAFRIGGSVAYPGLASAIFTWLRENDPERLRRASFALTCNGWIFSQMTGRYIADCTDASNPFSDVTAGDYSPELLRLFCVEEQRRLLPKIACGSELIGALTQGAAQQLGILSGTRVVMAPYDIVSTAYGAGSSSPGEACLILGTTICTETITDMLDLSCEPAGTTLALGDGLFLRAMPTLTGCETLEWGAKLLGLSTIGEMEDLAQGVELGSDGVVFLPYLSEAGERAPFLDPRAHGSLHGLSLSTARPAIARAIYEGLCCVIRECLAVTGSVNVLKVCGGGSRSDLWCQMIADVTGVIVQRPIAHELGARGAFLFALSATGALESVAEGAHRIPVAFTEFLPNPVRRKRYEVVFRRFCAMRDLARLGWQLKELSS